MDKAHQLNLVDVRYDKLVVIDYDDIPILEVLEYRVDDLGWYMIYQDILHITHEADLRDVRIVE